MTEPAPPPLDPLDPGGPPTAAITQTGRWTYLVVINHGLMQYGPDGYGWHRLGRGRAEKKARRELARYLRKEAREADTWTVTE